MAVHVPLSPGAINEAKTLMLSTSNMLAPRSGSPIVSPTLDMLLGLYYMTGPVMDTAVPVPTDALAADFAQQNGNSATNGHAGIKYYGNFQEARYAEETGEIGLRDRIRVRVPGGTRVWIDSTAAEPVTIGDSHDWIETTVGRIIFNEMLPDSIGFHNYVMREDEIDAVVHRCYGELGQCWYCNRPRRNETAWIRVRNTLRNHYCNQGRRAAAREARAPRKRSRKVAELQRMYEEGVITDEEKYTATIETWNETSDRVTDAVKEHLSEYNGVFAMSDSGAKGNLAQIKQMAGMRGLMSNPRGRIIDVPIEASFSEGLSVHEFFASTHGSRKALADTALKTAEAGYLTRRMADAAQNVIINERDCGTPIGMTITAEASRALNLPFEERIFSRYTVSDVVDPETGEIIATPDDLIDNELARRIAAGLGGAGSDDLLSRACWSAASAQDATEACSPTTDHPSSAKPSASSPHSRSENRAPSSRCVTSTPVVSRATATSRPVCLVFKSCLKRATRRHPRFSRRSRALSASVTRKATSSSPLKTWRPITKTSKSLTVTAPRWKSAIGSMPVPTS